MKTILLVVLFLCALVGPVFSDDSDISSERETQLVSTKILGGTESKVGDWPWITALLRSNESDMYQAQFCGGVLIGRSWVLTAAHCLTGESSASINVAIGAYDLRNYSGSRLSVKGIHIHPQYNSTTVHNDIALLELSHPSYQPKIALFSGESKEGVPPSMIGEMTVAIGWGMAYGSSYWYYPEILRQVNLPVVSNSLCNNSYSTDLLSSQMCVGYSEGKDVCNADSGGPIVSKVDERWVHIGLVSYGRPCDSSFGWYGVYTRTSGFVDFIKRYVPDVTIHQSKSAVKPTGIVLPWLNLLLSN